MRIENNDMYNHHTYHQPSHQVTDCVHEDAKVSKQQAPVSYRSSVTGNTGATQDAENAGADSPFSVIGKLFEKGKNLWLRIWGTSREPFDQTLSTEVEKRSENYLQNSSSLDKYSMLSGETGMKTAEKGQQEGKVNPYFVVQEEEKPKGIFRRFRMKVETATGFLAKKFPFAQTGSFQTKQEQNKEDLRKKSKYRKDDTEVDCILTDDSYLLDSYNKKGEYSKMNVEK